MGKATDAKDAAFFDAHVTFPFTIKTYEYDMEGHIKPKTFKTSAEMLKSAGAWAVPPAFVKAAAKSPEVRHGDQDCNLPNSVSYAKGARAITLKDTKATVKLMADACSAEGHDTTYELAADGGSFKIVSIAASN
jgi:hypothetical protein